MSARARCALLVVDPASGNARRSFVFPLVPERLDRAFVAGDEGALRETLSFTADLDALDTTDGGGVTELLESLGEIAREASQPDAALVLAWGERRLPVEIVRLSIAETAFDRALTTVRANVAIELAVLDVESSSRSDRLAARRR